jgi:zinc transporter
MEDSRACLNCCVLDGNGGIRPIEFSAMPAADGLVWLHLNGKHADTKKILRETIGLDAFIVKSMLAEETRPRLEETEQGTLVILRGINHVPGPEPEDLVSIRLWIGSNRIVSVSRRKARAVTDLEDRLRQGRGPRATGDFLATLCSCINDGIEPALQELGDETDEVDNISFEEPHASLREDLATLRRQATLFRRHLSPLRDVVARLRMIEKVWMSPADKWTMHDNADRLTRFIEELDAIRERTQILQDELYSAMSARLNRHIYILSIITVIFMPLSFLTGLLGINVEGIPGAKSPDAFWIVCVLTLMVVALQVYIFRRKRWL